MFYDTCAAEHTLSLKNCAPCHFPVQRGSVYRFGEQPQRNKQQPDHGAVGAGGERVRERASAREIQHEKQSKDGTGNKKICTTLEADGRRGTADPATQKG